MTSNIKIAILCESWICANGVKALIAEIITDATVSIFSCQKDMLSIHNEDYFSYILKIDSSDYNKTEEQWKKEISKKIKTQTDKIQETESANNLLTTREKDVLALVCKGFINKEIADKLGISLHTVISHRKNITHKLGIKTVSGLTVYAMMNGLM